MSKIFKVDEYRTYQKFEEGLNARSAEGFSLDDWEQDTDEDDRFSIVAIYSKEKSDGDK